MKKNFLQNNFSFYRSRDASDTGQMNNKMGNDQYCLRYMKVIKISLWGLKKTYACGKFFQVLLLVPSFKLVKSRI